MDGGAWWAAVHGVAKSRTRLSDLAAAAVADHSYSGSIQEVQIESFKTCNNRCVYIYCGGRFIRFHSLVPLNILNHN